MNAITGAIQILRAPIQDRHRELYHDLGDIMLIDDGGGEPIWRFDDVTAVHHFLVWLDERRKSNTHKRNVQARRSEIRLLQGGVTC